MITSSMIYVSILTGIVCILMGLFIAKRPNAIAGYNTMSEEQKAKVDIVKVAKILRNGLCIGGTLTIIGGIGFTMLDMPLLATLSVCLSIMLSVVISIVLAQKYDHNKRSLLKTVLLVAFIAITSAYISIDLYQDSRPTEITVDNNIIEFEGAYGLEISRFNVRNVELTRELPKIHRRVGGLGMGGIKKGNFELENYGISMLFLVDKEPPFIHIETTYGSHIFFNTEDSTYLHEIYKELTK